MYFFVKKIFYSTKNLKTLAFFKRLPTYIGSGYDIFQGNPKSNFIDPGFRATIFNLQYTQNLKTENLEFRIPDFTTSKTRSSCSYSSDFNQYTGTKEYQKDLRVYVGISATYSGLFYDASFSAFRLVWRQQFHYGSQI